MKKIKILDTVDSLKATARLSIMSAQKIDMFGKTFTNYVDKEIDYNIEGFVFAKESCEIIEVDDRPILSGEPPEPGAYYELSNDKEEWTEPCLIIYYYKDAAYPYRNLYDIYRYARKVEL
jgi:hypothetical protein